MSKVELTIFGELKEHKKSGLLHEKMLLINNKAIPEVLCTRLQVPFAPYLVVLAFLFASDL